MTITIDQVKVKCPYCGQEQMQTADRYNVQVGDCDTGEGGCGKVYAYSTKVTFTHDVRRIEGEDE